MAAADVDLTGAEPPVDEVDLTQDDDDELPASTATAAGAARLSGAAAGGGSGSARRSSGIGSPGMAARPMPWVHGLLGCKGRTDVMPPGLVSGETRHAMSTCLGLWSSRHGSLGGSCCA